MIECDSDAEELERMMAVVGGCFNPKAGNGVEQEATSSVMGQLESRDPTSEIEVLGEVMPPEDTSKVVVLGEAVPPKDTSGYMPSAEELVLGVAGVSVVGAAVGPSELALPSLMTAVEP